MLFIVHKLILTWAMGRLCVTWEGSTLVMVIPGGSLRLSMLKLFGSGCLDDKRLMALLICIAAGLVSLGAAWGWGAAGGAGVGAGAGEGAGVDLTFTSTFFFILLVIVTVGAVFWLLVEISFFVLLFTLFPCPWALFTTFALALFGVFFDFPLPFWLDCGCAAGCGGCCFPFPAFLESLPGSEETEQRKKLVDRKVEDVVN